MKIHRSLRAVLVAGLFPFVSAFATTDLSSAAAALKAGDLAAAETTLAPLVAGEKPDAGALHLLSQVRVAQKRAKEAIELAERASKLDPAKPEHFSQLGVALSVRMGEVGFMQQAMMAGRMKGAFEKSVELDPAHIAGLIGLARYYANAPEIAGGSLARAKEFALRVQALAPVQGASELGRIAERSEAWAEALTHYETALAARPDSAGLQVAAGRVLAKLGRPDEARARFTAALQLNPELTSAKQGLEALAQPGTR